MMVVWGFIILLTLAVIFLIWLQFNQSDEPRSVEGVPVEEKVSTSGRKFKKDPGNHAGSSQKNACAAGSAGSDHSQTSAG